MNFAEFLMKNKRAPFLSKGERPWTYKGWLMFYVQGLHADKRCSFPDRWGYLHQIMSGIDPGEIPQVEFSKPSREALNNLDECVDTIFHNVGSWDAFKLLVDWIMFGLGLDDNLPDLSEDLHEKLYKTLNLQLWLEEPFDYLAQYICEKKVKGWNPHAFYPTPHTVVQLMAEMTFHDEGKYGKDLRWKTVNDPCVGSGRMLLHASNYSLLLSGNDIDLLMVKCTKINGAVYAPWIVCPPTPPQESCTNLGSVPLP